MALLVVSLLSTVLTATGGSSITLKELDLIYIPAEPNAAEAEAANLIQHRLESLYTLKLGIAKGVPEESEPGILIGRAAVEGGMIAQTELDAVKHDGYVLRGVGDRIALSGYARQGTIYAAWALLQQLGLEVYPWYDGANQGAVEIFTPVAGGVLKPFDHSDKPFFEHRDLRTHVDRGRWGGTFRPYTLGDPSQAANQDIFRNPPDKRKEGYTKYEFERTDWVDWFHTAPYLVPRDLYYEDHPEYFAMKNGERIPPSRYARMAICDTHPDAIQIARQRAIEWMDIQKGRRIFCIVPADTSLCQCPRCSESDPIPDYSSDRVLTWVNGIAEAAQEKHPDKIIFTSAYSENVKPPIHVKPAPNVVIMYAPWFWNSRSSSAVTFESPLNMIAMKEFMGWIMWNPGQVGLYDYTGNEPEGTAQRVKLYARHGARWIYFQQTTTDWPQWLISQMIWDPFQDIEPLQEEFAKAYYGPAAKPMVEYYRLRQEAIERYGMHSRAVFSRGIRTSARDVSVGADHFNGIRKFLSNAEALADQAEEQTQIRILADVCRGIYPLLTAAHPQNGSPHLRDEPEVYRKDIKHYVELCERVMRSCERLGLTGLARQFGGTAANMNELLESLAEVTTADPPEPKSVTVRFGSSDEVGKWLSDGTRARLISPIEAAELSALSGEELSGIRIKAPLSKLPVIPRGNIEIHAGRFYVERVFQKPVEIGNCHFIDIHLHTSSDVPITIYINEFHSDFFLHAGEQIIRIDLRNFADLEVGKIERIGMDIWPQDNYYPYPETRDLGVMLLSLTASNQMPAPAQLPHKGKAIWLSQFRPNIPHRVAVPEELFDRYMQRQNYKHPGLDYGSRYLREGFRTFTEHRAVSPVFAILTSGADETEMEVARGLQHYLAEMFDVLLPIDPPGLSPGSDTGNVILIGKEACLAAGWVQPKELDHVSAGGFVIHAWQGRVALAGYDTEGTAAAARRYLEDHFARFYAPGVARVPDLKTDLLHELYILDQPWFTNRPPWERSWLQASDESTSLAAEWNAEETRQLARAIKDIARAGENEVTPEILKTVEKSALSRYVISCLLRNPFADATRGIREFPKDDLE